MDTRWRIWMRDQPRWAWREPVVDTDGDGSFESRADAESFAEEFRARGEADAAVVVLPDGQHPEEQSDRQSA